MLHTYGLDGMLGLLSVNEVDEALLLGIRQVIPQHLNQRKNEQQIVSHIIIILFRLFIAYLAIDDRSVLLELLEEHVVGDVRRQVSDEATRSLAKLGLRLDVPSREGLITVRRPVNNRSRIAH